MTDHIKQNNIIMANSNCTTPAVCHWGKNSGENQLKGRMVNFDLRFEFQSMSLWTCDKVQHHHRKYDTEKRHPLHGGDETKRGRARGQDPGYPLQSTPPIIPVPSSKGYIPLPRPFTHGLWET